MDVSKVKGILEDAKYDLKELAEDLYLETDLPEEYIVKVLQVIRSLSNIELKYH